MRWFTSVSVWACAIAAALFYAPPARACPLCFASAGPGVLRAYLVSAVFMIGLAWSIIGMMCLYVIRKYSDGTPQKDATVTEQIAESLHNSPTVVNCTALVTQVAPARAGEDGRGL